MHAKFHTHLVTSVCFHSLSSLSKDLSVVYGGVSVYRHAINVISP